MVIIDYYAKKLKIDLKVLENLMKEMLKEMFMI